jgi:hypothetical protein
MDCSEEGEVTSIALPVLGSNLGYPIEVFAKTLKKVIDEYDFKWLNEIIICEFELMTFKKVSA